MMKKVKSTIKKHPDSRTFIGLLCLAFIGLAAAGAGQISNEQQRRIQEQQSRKELISDWCSSITVNSSDTETLSDEEKAAIFRLAN